MTLRKFKWYLIAYVLFDLLIGGTCAGFLPLTQLAAAQFTTVTGTVVDPNGTPYAFGTISATLVLPGGTSPTLGGLPYTPPTQPTGLDKNGSFTLQLADNTQLQPGGTQWNFTVCSALGTVQPAGGKGPVCFSLAAPITISGSSQSISSNLNAVALALTSGSGASSPSSLSTFFTKFYGKAPQDYGAFGDWHIYQAAINNTSTTLTCAQCVFTSADTGKTYEVITSANGVFPVTSQTGTITFLTSTTVQLSVAANATLAATRFGYGHNDTAAMQSWVNGMCAASVGGVPSLVHGGYLPQGGYYITQVLPCTNTQSSGIVNNGGGSTSTNGECGSAASTQGFNLRCSVWITGIGFSSSTIYVATAGTFSWPTTSGTTQSGNACAFNIQNWDSVTLNGFGILFDGTPQNTTTVTGKVAGLCLQNSSHANVYEMWVQNAHNTTNNLMGFLSYNDFESKYEHNAFEGSDFNAVVDGESGNTIEKITFADVYLENPGSQATSNIGQNMVLGDPIDARALTMKQIRLRGVHFLGSTLVDLAIDNITNSLSDAIRVDESRSTGGGASSLGLLIQLGTNPSTVVELHGTDLISSSAIDAIDIINTNAVLKMFGGTINAGTNAINSTGTVVLNQVQLAGGAIAGAGQVYFNSVATVFANLPSTAGNGSTIGCSNCAPASSPCTGASTGAIAVRQNAAWVCK